MESINNIINLLLSSGGTVVMAVLFIIFLFFDRKDRKEKEKAETKERKEERAREDKLLSEISATNRNIAESLNLLKVSMDNTNTEFRQHDERAIKEFEEIKTDIKIIKERK